MFDWQPFKGEEFYAVRCLQLDIKKTYKLALEMNLYLYIQIFINIYLHQGKKEILRYNRFVSEICVIKICTILYKFIICQSSVLKVSLKQHCICFGTGPIQMDNPIVNLPFPPPSFTEPLPCHSVGKSLLVLRFAQIVGHFKVVTLTSLS